MTLLLLNKMISEVRPDFSTFSKISIFDSLQSFGPNLSEIKIAIDRNNKIYFSIYFSIKQNIKEDLLLAAPDPLLTAEKIIFEGHQSNCEINLRQLEMSAAKTRIIEVPNSLTAFTKITFYDIFDGKVPNQLTDINKILDYTENENLLTALPTQPLTEIKFNYFDRTRLLLKKFHVSDKELKFEIDDKKSKLGIQVSLKPDPNKTIYTFNYSESSSALEQFFIAQHTILNKLNIGLELYCWDHFENYSLGLNNHLSESISKFLILNKEKIDQFLNSTEIKSKVEQRSKELTIKAVKILDQRKSLVASQNVYQIAQGKKFKHPENEQETVLFFNMLVVTDETPFFEFEMHEYAASQGIDAICSYKLKSDDVLKKFVATEFEFVLSNFFKHGHPLQHAEIIICWEIDKLYPELKKGENWLHELEHQGRIIPVIEIMSFPNLKDQKNDW